MKKAVALIMIALPIFLMIAISLAGRLFISFIPVSVESVHFINESGEQISKLEIIKGQSERLMVQVLPELATNKKVLYFMAQNPVCNLEGDVVTVLEDAPDTGTAEITVMTEEKNLMERILIVVKQETSVQSIAFNYSSYDLYIGESFDSLTVMVLPITATNKRVTLTSSNPSKVIIFNNKPYAVEATAENETVRITATSEDGGLEAYCDITVLDSPMGFKRSDGSALPPGSVIIVRNAQIDIRDYLVFDESQIDYESIVFRITGDESEYTFDGTILTLLSSFRSILITAEYVLDGTDVICSAQFMLNPNAIE